MSLPAATKIPVFLLTGFLGSGKTTLLNAALRAPALARTAVVVNEFGDIGLDHLIISQASDNVVLLEGGCLCCANTGALHETLADLASRRASGALPPFERVVIETSGAADPAPLLNVLLGHPLVISRYTLEATVCVVDAQHFLDARIKYSQLDKQAAVAERIVISKTDLADPSSVRSFLKSLNPDAELFLESPAITAFYPCEKKHRAPITAPPFSSIRAPRHVSGFRAHSFRPPAPVTWAGWSAWSRLVAHEFGNRLVRVKGLLRMADTGEIAFVNGVQGVFHTPHRFHDWPDADHNNRLVCITRDIEAADVALTLRALNTAAGTQAHYSMQDLKQLSDMT